MQLKQTTTDWSAWLAGIMSWIGLLFTDPKQAFDQIVSGSQKRFTAFRQTRTMVAPVAVAHPASSFHRRSLTWRGIWEAYNAHALLYTILGFALIFGVAMGIDQVQYSQRLSAAMANPLPVKAFMGIWNKPLATATAAGEVRVSSKDSILVEFGGHSAPVVYDLTIARYYLENAGVPLPKVGQLMLFYWRQPGAECRVPFWGDGETAETSKNVLCLAVMDKQR